MALILLNDLRTSTEHCGLMSPVSRILKRYNYVWNIHINGHFTAILLIEIESAVYYAVYCQDQAVFKIQPNEIFFSSLPQELIFSNECEGAARTKLVDNNIWLFSTYITRMGEEVA